MKTDTYTKVILTIIAACLTFNLLKDLEMIPKAQAAENIIAPAIATDYKLVPVNANNTMDVRIVDINTYDELHVNLKNIDTHDELKVNINSIDTSDEIDVNIDEIGGRYISHGNPIPVSIEKE